MRLDYINPIVESAVNVLSEFTGSRAERGSMELHGDGSPKKDVAAVIGMAGEVEGRIILEMSRDTALSVASALNGEKFSELTSYALDTVMELTNVMVARAVSTLNDRGFTFRLTPPLIFTGQNLCFSSGLNIETLVIPLRANVGEMVLNVALRMNIL